MNDEQALVRLDKSKLLYFLFLYYLQFKVLSKSTEMSESCWVTLKRTLERSG